MTGSTAPTAPRVPDGRPAAGCRSRRVRTGGLVLAATILALGTVACSKSDGVAPQTISAHTTTSPTAPSTGTSGSGGPDSPTASGGGSTGPSGTEATGSKSEPGSVSSTAGMTLSSTTLLPTTRTPTNPVLPPQTSISLASSASFSVTAPNFDRSADAVIEGYIGSWRISDQATANPSIDWKTSLSRYMADPFLSQFLDSLHQNAQKGLRSVGHVSVVAEVKTMSPTSATIIGCVDTSHQDTIDKQGRSVVVANGPGAYWRYVEVATMKLIDDSWRLSSVNPDWNTKC